MVGAVIDNNVFEILVDKLMPVLGDHLRQHDIQLSVACLPWFLTLYVNSLPLPYALRIMDWFFLEGAKVLFQIGLSILKVNGDAIMKVQDDGDLMRILKDYFLTLGECETETASGAKPTIKFHQLIVTAYSEFRNVTNEVIVDMRKSQSLKSIQKMDLYAKRSAVRNVRFYGKFNKDELLYICDQFYSVQFYSKASRMCDRINCEDFSALLGIITPWANLKAHHCEENINSENPIQPIIGTVFIENLFKRVFDKNNDGFVDLQDVIKGLSQLAHSDTTGVLSAVFSAHDGNQDGYLNRDETIQLSETFLFLLRNNENEKKLGSLSSFLNRAFMMNLTAQSETSPDEYVLSFDNFKELISADDYLLNYFSFEFPKTFFLADTNTGMQQKIYTPPMRDITDSLITGGMKWATGKLGGVGRKMSTLAIGEKKVAETAKVVEISKISGMDVTFKASIIETAEDKLLMQEVIELSEDDVDDLDTTEL